MTHRLVDEMLQVRQPSTESWTAAVTPMQVAGGYQAKLIPEQEQTLRAIAAAVATIQSDPIAGDILGQLEKLEEILRYQGQTPGDTLGAIGLVTQICNELLQNIERQLVGANQETIAQIVAAMGLTIQLNNQILSQQLTGQGGQTISEAVSAVGLTTQANNQLLTSLDNRVASLNSDNSWQQTLNDIRASFNWRSPQILNSGAAILASGTVGSTSNRVPLSSSCLQLSLQGYLSSSTANADIAMERWRVAGSTAPGDRRVELVKFSALGYEAQTGLFPAAEAIALTTGAVEFSLRLLRVSAGTLTVYVTEVR